MSEVITSVDNPLVKHAVKLRSSARYRKEQGELLLVGRKLVNEAPHVSTLLLEIGISENGDPRFLAPHVMKKVTGLDSPDGWAAIVKQPKLSLPSPIERLLILDGVADPGNLGTLLRTALALGWEGVLLVGDCCDPFNDKSLRASRGAPLRFPVLLVDWEEAEACISSNNLMKVVGETEGEEKVPVDGGIALILGSEGQGLSGQALKGAKKLTIAMPGEMESLNVGIAGGILMHLLRRSQ